ncbi:GNAT family N-acetyltransferase, partial [Pontibacter sp. HJ8]
MPVVVIKTNGAKLTGLFTLAKDLHGRITGAGTNQAEYQVWLASSADSRDFFRDALSEIRRKFPQSNITLKYIPATAPLDWAESGMLRKTPYFLRSAGHPLVVINKDNIAQELKKKNRREKINRLKRMGELRFEKITDRQTFTAIIDELAIQSDFRKGAMYNKSVFQSEPFRKDFLCSLFDQNILHATLLRLNEEIISSNVG